MGNPRTLLVVGLSALALVGAAGWAAAQSRAHTHVMTVRLPNGAVEQIRYTGDIAPRVAVSALGAPIVLATPTAAPFDWAGPFALMDQITARMDGQSLGMLQQLGALAMPGPQAAAEFGVPAIGQGLSFASSLTGKGVCGHSVAITSTGDGKAPQVVSKSWGDCAAAPAAKPPAAAPAKDNKVSI